MNIHTKLDLGQKCYYIQNNKIKSAEVTRITVYIREMDDILIEYTLSPAAGMDKITIFEDTAFESVEELLDYLRKNAK